MVVPALLMANAVTIAAHACSLVPPSYHKVKLGADAVFVGKVTSIEFEGGIFNRDDAREFSAVLDGYAPRGKWPEGVNAKLNIAVTRVLFGKVPEKFSHSVDAGMLAGDRTSCDLVFTGAYFEEQAMLSWKSSGFSMSFPAHAYARAYVDSMDLADKLKKTADTSFRQALNNWTAGTCTMGTDPHSVVTVSGKDTKKARRVADFFCRDINPVYFIEESDVPD